MNNIKTKNPISKTKNPISKTKNPISKTQSNKSIIQNIKSTTTNLNETNTDIDFNIDLNIDFNIDLDELKVSTEKNDLTKKISNRISETNYIRPQLTYTDKLSKEQVKELLVDYEQIKTLQQLQNINSGSHLRYFEYKDGELKFRTGGILTIVSGLPDYIILNNNKIMVFVHQIL